MSVGSYTVEYSKSSRAACQTCDQKIPKGDLRIGKMVDMKLKSSYTGSTSRILPAWHHYDCFWGPAYVKQSVDEERVWGNFDGIGVLIVEDQEKLHLKIKGKAMPKTAVKQAVKEEKAAEKLAVYTDSAPDIIIVTMIEKAFEKSKMTDINKLFSAYKIDKQKKKRKADLIKILMDTELTVFPGFVYSCIDKTMTANDLKSTLQSRNLKVSGNKPTLIWRLLETQNIAKSNDIFEWPSDADKKKRKVEKEQEKRWERGDFSDDDYYSSRHDVYKKDEQDSPIVLASRKGDLDEVERILKQKRNSSEILNKARKWTEVQEKWGYDKSWAWYGDTPLIAAASGGHYKIVKLLLLKGSDPTLVSCPSDDVHVCAINGRHGNNGAAEKTLTQAEKELKQLENGDLPSYNSIITNKHVDAKDTARNLLEKIAGLKTTISLVTAAAPFWTSTTASTAHADNKRTYNSVSDAAALKAAVDAVSAEKDYDVSEAERLAVSITNLRTKHTKPVQNAAPRFTQHRVHARVIPGVMNNGAGDSVPPVRHNTQYHRPDPTTLSAAARPFVPNWNSRSGAASTQHGAASTQHGAARQQACHQTGQQECHQTGCDKLFAKACHYRRCGSCCPGPCIRHCR